MSKQKKYILGTQRDEQPTAKQQMRKSNTAQSEARAIVWNSNPTNIDHSNITEWWRVIPWQVMNICLVRHASRRRKTASAPKYPKYLRSWQVTIYSTCKMPYGISNSFKRFQCSPKARNIQGLTWNRSFVRTYSRQPQRASQIDSFDYPTKRICLKSASRASEDASAQNADPPLPSAQPINLTSETSSTTVPSSPPQRHAQIFSDNALLDTDSELSSPPSSPPLAAMSPTRPALKPVFSFLKRKRSAVDEPEPLAESSHNARKTPRLRDKSGLKQMQIDLGGEVRKTCDRCGMEYVLSNKEDLILHQEFHDMNKDGVDVGRTFLKDSATKLVAPIARQLQKYESIIMVDRRSSLASRNKVKKVLEIVNTELSAAPIEDSRLWGGLDSILRVEPMRKTTKDTSSNGGAGFKAFLYLDGDRCVGLCLVERINVAYRVAATPVSKNAPVCISAVASSSSVAVSDKQDVALLGVSRIWTSRAYRRRGIAVALLECARRYFFYGMEVTKDLIAFSQPTESGGRLAKHWFEASEGWHVFRDES